MTTSVPYRRDDLRIPLLVLQLSMAAVWLWFGIPKLFPGGSPAEDLADRTISALTGGLITGDVARIALAVGEIAIGLGIVAADRAPVFIAITALHLVGTFTPLALFPREAWQSMFVGTLEGQYILKNIVYLAVLFLLGWVYFPRWSRRRTSESA